MVQLLGDGTVGTGGALMIPASAYATYQRKNMRVSRENLSMLLRAIS
jgi:hypothetical protein